MSSSQQEIKLGSSMQMDSMGAATALKFFLFCFQHRKEHFLFRHIFGLLKHHLLTLAHVAPTFCVHIPQ
jgi:hypothetical protein